MTQDDQKRIIQEAGRNRVSLASIQNLAWVGENNILQLRKMLKMCFYIIVLVLDLQSTLID